MPIVTLQVVTDDNETTVEQSVIQQIADELGTLFGTSPGETWVKVEPLSRFAYAENETVVPASIRPVMVDVLRYQLPDTETLKREARQVAEIVAGALKRPVENTHVFFQPDGKGRVAFGGNLVEE